MMANEFTATVRQVFALTDRHLLVLEEYAGDVGPGDVLEVSLPGEGATRVYVRDLAWGSAFTASDPPLTLIVDCIEGPLPESGASIRPAR